jgi:hypothetical protein
LTNFTYKAYAEILQAARDSDYLICNIRDFIKNGKSSSKTLVLRHDIDKNPNSLLRLAEVELKFGVTSSIFLRVAGAEYNPFSYQITRDLLYLEENGFDIGLHSNFLEFASLINLDPISVLENEVRSLKAFYKVIGISCHRDINYLVNSLPFLEKNWQKIKKITKLEYDAYDKILFSELVYVSESLKPHLTWSNNSPIDEIKNGNSVYLLTHNHWWYESIPYLS